MGANVTPTPVVPPPDDALDANPDLREMGVSSAAAWPPRGGATTLGQSSCLTNILSKTDE